MNWLDEYKNKICSIDEASSVVKSNHRVYISGNAATPYVLLDGLAKQGERLKNVEIVHVLLWGDEPTSKPDMVGHFRHNSLFVGPADREAVNAGRADYIPVFLYQIPNLFYSGILPLDVSFIHTSPPDQHGFLSLGVEALCSKAAAETANIVVCQVNDNMPRTLGDCFIHISRVNKIVEVSEDLPELIAKEPTQVEKHIADYILSLIEDGSTLQLGIGGIPDAVIANLRGRRNLGIHTEMVSDGIMGAIESGVVTGAKKTLHPGKVIATFIFGSKNLYQYSNNNPIFEMHPCDYTNNPFIVAQNEKMVAINSAIEVDLTGQICADSIGYKVYSGIGGQVDFIRGAASSKEGRPIIALPSTAKDGKISRIVATLKEGAGVVTSRGDVHYVVTEFGIAYLHGKNLRERALALISIAHPDHREQLEKNAYEKGLLKK